MEMTSWCVWVYVHDIPVGYTHQLRSPVPDQQGQLQDVPFWEALLARSVLEVESKYGF